MQARLLTLVGVALLVSCGGGADSGSAPPGPASPGDARPAMMGALCDAAAAETAEEAAGYFYGSAHRPLHELAAAVADRDRQRAARLLEAKRAVEDALPDGSGAGADWPARLDDLEEATRAALEVMGSPAPPCPTGDSTR